MSLTPFQKDVLNIYPPPRLFAVVSWGCAGTAWIARVLNSHPDIFCVHSAATFWRTFAEAPQIDGKEYMRLLGAQGFSHKVAGDVHGVSRSSINSIEKEFGSSFRKAVVVRDPVPRVRSQLALMARLKNYKEWDVDYVDAAARNLDMDPTNWTNDDRLKFHAVNMLNAIEEEKNINPIFRIEDLSSNQSTFLEFFSHLTDGLPIPNWWLKYIDELQSINSHNNRTKSANWDINNKLLRSVVSQQAWEEYRKLGYDIPN